MTAPHETPEFQNSVEYTVEITFRVEGGARWQTAYGRAERIAERLANHAARAAHVAEVHAVGGPSEGDEPMNLGPGRFSEANTGHGTYGDPSKLDRWIDPEFERALDSLVRANAEARARLAVDRDRRQSLGCANAYRRGYEAPRHCLCVYCGPDRHLDTLTGLASGLQFLTARCLCGQPVATPHQRCLGHREVEVAVLDGDSESLQRVADLIAEHRQRLRDPEVPNPPDPPGIDGPELPPARSLKQTRRTDVSDHTITLGWPATDVLAYAIQRTMDDLEARAIVAEHHDPELGPVSARDYRADIARLRSVLDQISPDIRLPDPEQAAVRWIDGTSTIVDGQPVPMLAQPELRELLEATTALRAAGLLSADQALDLLATAIDRGTPERAIPAPERATTETFRAPGHQVTRDIEPPAAPVITCQKVPLDSRSADIQTVVCPPCQSRPLPVPRSIADPPPTNTQQSFATLQPTPTIPGRPALTTEPPAARTSSTFQTSSLDTPQAPHRLAPGCGARRTLSRARGAGLC